MAPRARTSAKSQATKSATKSSATAKAEDPVVSIEETRTEIDEIRTNGTIQAKVAWIQQRVPHVAKSGQVEFVDRQNRTTKYDHMQEHGLLMILRPLWETVGICVTESIPEHTKSGNHLQIAGELVVTDINPRGERPTAEWQIRASYPNEGVDTTDKASNKALTGWMKYALQKFFKVPTEAIDDNDTSDVVPRTDTAPESHEPPKLTEADATALRATINKAVEEGHLTNERVKALLQGTYAVSRLEELAAEDAKAVATWVAAEVKKSA